MTRCVVVAALAAVLAVGCGPGAEANKPNPDLKVPENTADPNAKPSRGGTTAPPAKK